MSKQADLYDEDIVAWSEQQAEALRAAAHAGSNLQLDWENLAEEIADLGKSYRRSLKSQLRRIIQHLIKLQYSPALDPRRDWRRSIFLARMEVEELLQESPSLRREVSQLIQDVTPSAIQLALASLEAHDESDAMRSIPVRRRSYTDEQVLGQWFPPELGEDGETRR